MDYSFCNVHSSRSTSWITVFAMMPFDGKYQNLQKTHMLALALTVSVIITFDIFVLQKVGQGHGMQFSQRHH